MPCLTRLSLARIMRYYRLACDLVAKEDVRTITSAQVSDVLRIDPTQVRKDFGVIGLRGRGRVGFDLRQVRHRIRATVGIDRSHEAVLLGVGSLGSSLLAYLGFAEYGLLITAAFDTDREKIGREIAGITVRSARRLEAYVAGRDIRLAVLTTPAGAAQSMTDRLVSAGVRAIWNFSPSRLAAPPSVFVRNEHVYLSIGLSEIAYHLKHAPKRGAGLAVSMKGARSARP